MKPDPAATLRRSDRTARPPVASPVASRLRLAAAATLVAGLGAAGWLRLFGDLGNEAATTFERTRLQELQLERMGGKFAVEAARFTQWFDSLWSGEKLPVTILVCTVAGAAFLWWIAGLAAVDVGDEETRDRRRTGGDAASSDGDGHHGHDGGSHGSDGGDGGGD